MFLCGCTPAVYIELYNATGQAITVATDSFPKPIALAPNASGQLPFIFAQGQHLERLFVRTSTSSWYYRFLSFHVPPSFWQHGTLGTMRVYTKIDASRRVYLLAPPKGSGAPEQTQQPPGFPVKPFG